jgi:putative peptidoglycan lipid II flippase
MTALALIAYALGFMGFSFVKILVPGYYARQEVKLPVRFGIIAILCGMAMSLGFVGLSKWLAFDAPHAGLALATSLSAWINAGLLYWRLRRDGIYVPGPGWGAFGLRLALGCCVMSAVALALSGPLQAWLDAPLHGRALWIAEVIGAAALAYFATLAIAGLRPSHLRRA